MIVKSHGQIKLVDISHLRALLPSCNILLCSGSLRKLPLTPVIHNLSILKEEIRILNSVSPKPDHTTTVLETRVRHVHYCVDSEDLWASPCKTVLVYTYNSTHGRTSDDLVKCCHAFRMRGN